MADEKYARGERKQKDAKYYHDELKDLLYGKHQFINKDTYVDDAFKCLGYSGKQITTSKLRSIYAVLCDIRQDEDKKDKDENISKECLAALKLLKVRIIYDMGRDEEAVKLFMKNTHLVAYICDIEKTKSCEKFDLFCKYFEALVAFHRYMNPKET